MNYPPVVFLNLLKIDNFILIIHDPKIPKYQKYGIPQNHKTIEIGKVGTTYFENNNSLCEIWRMKYCWLNFEGVPSVFLSLLVGEFIFNLLLEVIEKISLWDLKSASKERLKRKMKEKDVKTKKKKNKEKQIVMNLHVKLDFPCFLLKENQNSIKLV